MQLEHILLPDISKGHINWQGSSKSFCTTVKLQVLTVNKLESYTEHLEKIQIHLQLSLFNTKILNYFSMPHGISHNFLSYINSGHFYSLLQLYFQAPLFSKQSSLSQELTRS